MRNRETAGCGKEKVFVFFVLLNFIYSAKRKMKKKSCREKLAQSVRLEVPLIRVVAIFIYCFKNRFPPVVCCGGKMAQDFESSD